MDCERTFYHSLLIAIFLLGGALAGDEDRTPGLAKPLPDPSPLRDKHRLGFVLHWGQTGTGEYVTSGAPSMLVNLFCWKMRDQKRQLVDFAPAESWLAYLYRNGLTSAVIIDTSIHHTSSPWRSRHTRDLGENVVNQDGGQTACSSPLSPEYRRMVDQYIRDLTGWVSKNDRAHRVTTYVNGAEVFWPGVVDFGHLAAESFRRWLLERYGGLEQVNRRWRAHFEDTQDIPVLPVWRVGDGERSPRQFIFRKRDNGAWVTPLSRVRADAAYSISAEVRAQADGYSRVELLVAWTADNHPPAHSDTARADPTPGEWQRLVLTVEAPQWAQRGDIYLHFEGSGGASWRNLTAATGKSEQSAISNPSFELDDEAQPKNWSKAVWNGQIDFAVASEGEQRALSLRSSGEGLPSCGFDPAVFWYDFQTYCTEVYAETMNHWARRIKQCDPTRDVMHYLGFVLGTLGQWDDLMFTQRADIFLANAPDVDIHGLQLCAANGDFHFATVNLDLARKHRKPMVATDLQDFTHGVYVGFNSLNRTTLACIAHGMRGAYYYCWYDHNIDYNWYHNWPVANTRRILENARKCIEFLEGAQLKVAVAFLLPIQPYSEADPEGGKSDMLDAMGWYKALCQAGLCVDVLTPYELSRRDAPDLSAYRLVVVPDCPVLPAVVAERLVRYTVGGGHVLLGGRPPVLDETGRGLTEPLAQKPRAAGSEPIRIRHGEGHICWIPAGIGREYLGPVRRYRVAGNTPPLFQPDGNWRWPREIGKELLRLIRQEVRAAGALPVWLNPPDPYVELAAYREDGRWKVVLIHTGPGMHRNGRLVFAESPHSSAEVWADFEKRPAKTSKNKSEQGELQLPVFEDSCLVQW